MKNVIVYTGQAGTGKTWSLINKLKEIASGKEWKDFESVLAITFMHGSRNRLNKKLNFLKKEFKINYHCSTIDSFVLFIVNKFRSYLEIQKVIYPSFGDNAEPTTNDIHLIIPLEEIQKMFITLLDNQYVKEIISNSYPIIIIDEFQDCVGNLFQIVKKLSNCSELLIATDPFQQLHDIENSEGQIWLEENQGNCEINNLDSGRIWRTSNVKVLNSAKALRTGTKNSEGKIKVLPFTKTNLSFYIKLNIYFNSYSDSTAIITPSGTSMIENAIKDLSKPSEFKGNTIGPYNQLLSKVKTVDAKDIIAEYAYEDKNIPMLKELSNNKNFIVKNSSEIAQRILHLRNLTSISKKEFEFIIKKITHNYNNFILIDKQSKITYTTVHGAKNREFDSVIVVWPYVVAGNDLYKRKLLYNAITRAKKSAVLLIQHRTRNIEELKSNELFSLVIN